ncbi:hypothetical protein [Marmoricola sp. RAF53]|uniref:hypothetical protein n=1 Tax=Marmoricola sp. RAF53 TaxID=3233059 RepID=UPI003F97AAD2
MESNPTRHDEQRLVIRPVLWSIIPGWILTLFGLIFVLAGLSEPSDVGTLLVMCVGGIGFGYIGFSLATASATVTRAGIRYRNGVILRRIATEDVASVEVGPGSGVGYSRITLVIGRRAGKPVAMTPLQRADTEKGRRDLSDRAAQVVAILGLG